MSLGSREMTVAEVFKEGREREAQEQSREARIARTWSQNVCQVQQVICYRAVTAAAAITAVAATKTRDLTVQYFFIFFLLFI